MDLSFPSSPANTNNDVSDISEFSSTCSSTSSKSKSSSLNTSNSTSIKRSEETLLDGCPIPSDENKVDSFVYSAFEAMKKNTVDIIYESLPFSISPFDILSDYPDGDFTYNEDNTWSGVLNVHVTILAGSDLSYPPQYDSSKDVSVMVDIMKCTRKEFSKKNFYLSSMQNPDKNSVVQLSTALCSSACMSGYSLVCKGTRKSWCKSDKSPTYDLKNSFLLSCQRSQVYVPKKSNSDNLSVSKIDDTKLNRKRKGPQYCQPVHNRSNISKQLYKPGVREQSAVNDRKNN